MQDIVRKPPPGHRPKKRKVQARVVLYTGKDCRFCQRAKQLLAEEKIEYREVVLDDKPELRRKVLQASGGRRALPQVFIERRHLGGFFELKRMIEGGGLTILLDH